MKHTLIIEMRDDGLALNRVTSLLHRRAAESCGFAMDRASQQNRLRVTMVVDDQYTDAARLATHFRNLQCIFSVRHLGPTEMLARQLALLKVRMDANRRNEILGVVHKHGAQVVDLTPGSLILQFSGTQDQISDLVADLSRIAVIVEMACSGPIALPHYDTRAVGR